jgi:uncharacterized protein YicC (UPF0701 family)
MPEIRSPKAASEDLTKLAKDALYVGVGLGVIAFQKLQVQRQELMKRGDGRSLTKLVEDRVKTVEERLEGVESRIDKALEQLESRLPEQAREVSKQARTAAKEARTQVRSLVNRGAA